MLRAKPGVCVNLTWTWTLEMTKGFDMAMVGALPRWLEQDCGANSVPDFSSIPTARIL